jgi:hypothetical protein
MIQGIAALGQATSLCLKRISDSVHPVTWHHIPEERRHQLHRREILQTRNTVSSFDYTASRYNIVTE